jgi:pantoate--beta-alanine ligase
MGALHDGHLELVRQARLRCPGVVASLFVNPLQFGKNEDLARYPRDPLRDRERFAAEGVDALFAPDAATMYPASYATYVSVDSSDGLFEGAIRPGHFRGVMTVLAKLLNIVRPDMLFLGQKDAQQAVLTRKMTDDLNFSVEVEIVPTVREPDGLAMSSRNRYLSEQERSAAPTLYAALRALRAALAEGAPKARAIAAAESVLSPLARLDYLDVVDADTFEPIEELRPPAFVIGAARFGTTRLIDNVWVPQ